MTARPALRWRNNAGNLAAHTLRLWKFRKLSRSERTSVRPAPEDYGLAVFVLSRAPSREAILYIRRRIVWALSAVTVGTARGGK